MTEERNMNNNHQNDDNSTQEGSNKRIASPFSLFEISSTKVLETIEKALCPKCKKNVRYFCNKCLVLVNCPEGSVPQLKLPVKMDIIKHENERDGKSTALHAKILAPDQVQVYGWKNMPEYENIDRLLLLFPSPDAKRLSDIDPSSFDKLVVIDGTWDQVKKMTSSDGPISKMRRVAIGSHETLFWRHQRKADDHLATIEAIYYLLREYHEAYLVSIAENVKEGESKGEDESSTKEKEKKEGKDGKDKKVSGDMILTKHGEWIEKIKVGDYTNQYDDMLWFYKYFYELIQKNYRERRDGREFTLRHKKGYIQYENDSKGGEGKGEGVGKDKVE